MMENSWSYSEFWAIEIVADVSNEKHTIREKFLNSQLEYELDIEIKLILD